MAPIDLFEDVENDSADHSDQPQPPSRKNNADSFHYNEAYAQKFERQKRGEELMKRQFCFLLVSLRLHQYG
jgi:hypothetical protein